MKIKACSLQNFASYKELNFDFTSQGLTLIQGPTGSGKSTLCDIIPWTLFGLTSKGGKVDEILSWPGHGITCSSVTVDSRHTIVRSRGRLPRDNDLLILDSNGDATRGKDLKDTQKLINNLLGFDYDLYLAGVYYHEFSQTAQFFTTSAQNRRIICEQLVDLSLAKKLQVRLADEYKERNQTLHKLIQDIRDNEFKLVEKIKAQTAESERWDKWNTNNTSTKAYVSKCYEAFEANRTQVKYNKCSSCGTVLTPEHKHTNTEPNPHIDRLLELEVEMNPFSQDLKDFSEEIQKYKNFISADKVTERLINQHIADIEQLQEIVQDYRSVSIRNTIFYIEEQTNRLLTTYFDAEIKVGFSVESADKIDVSITKDGNEASFTQLSKGQRTLLKLCFGLSVMQAVQNHHGIKFEQIFLDEALDGLSEEFKIKAFNLLDSVSQGYDSTFVVEHSTELKSRFLNSFRVELIDGKSQIEKA